MKEEESYMFIHDGYSWEARKSIITSKICRLLLFFKHHCSDYIFCLLLFRRCVCFATNTFAGTGSEKKGERARKNMSRLFFLPTFTSDSFLKENIWNIFAATRSRKHGTWEWEEAFAPASCHINFDDGISGEKNDAKNAPAYQNIFLPKNRKAKENIETTAN